MTPSPTPLLDPATAALATLAEHIVATHHAYCQRELPLIEKELRAARAADDSAELRQLEAGFQHLSAALLQHLKKEETILFPLITAIEAAVRARTPPPRPAYGSVGNPIRMMTLEHSEAEVLLAKLRQFSRGFEAPPGAAPAIVALYGRLRAFDADMQRHVEIEDQVLFPRAIDAEQQAAERASTDASR